MPVGDGSRVGTGASVETGDGAGDVGKGAGGVAVRRDFDRSGFRGVAGTAAGGAAAAGGVRGVFVDPTAGIVTEKVRGAFETTLVSRRGERDHRTMPVPRTFSAEGVNTSQAFLNAESTSHSDRLQWV